MKKLLLAALLLAASLLPADAQTLFSMGSGGGGGGGTPCTVTASSLQYNNGGAFGCVTDWTSNGTVLTGALGSISANTIALQITGTFNNAATTFDAPFLVNITNTASHAGSALFDFQVGGTSQFGYFPNASLLALGNSTTPVSMFLYDTVDTLGGPTNFERLNIKYGTDPNSVGTDWQIYPSSGGTGSNRGLFVAFNQGGSVAFEGVSAAAGISFNYFGTALFTFGNGTHTFANGSRFGWRSGASSTTGNFDTALSRGGSAGQLQLFNHDTLTSATGFFVYNTTDVTTGAPTNYERFVIDWTASANTATIGMQSGGTGSQRNVQVTGTNSWQFNQASTWWNSGNNGLIFSATGRVVSPTDNTLGPRTGWLNWGGQASLDADFSATSNTVLANVTGTSDNLTMNLLAGETYNFQVGLFMVTGASAGGIKIGFGGTATVTNFIADGNCLDGTTIVAVTRISSLTQLVANTNAGTTPQCELRGTFTVLAAGTFTVQFAQNASSATSSTVKRGSYMNAHDVHQ